MEFNNVGLHVPSESLFQKTQDAWLKGEIRGVAPLELLGMEGDWNKKVGTWAVIGGWGTIKSLLFNDFPRDNSNIAGYRMQV